MEPNPRNEPDPTPGLAIIDYWVAEKAAMQRVVAAARAYGDFTHGNITGPRYRQRQEARDAMLDALEALDDVKPPA